MASAYTNSWAKQFCRAIDAPFNTQVDLFLRSWAQSESSVAKNNPFATTQPWPNSTDFNSVHVKNYATWQDGVAATAKTIKNGKYPTLLAALQKGTSANTMAAALKASPWGTGALAIEVLKYGPPEFPYGNSYPTPPASYAHGTAKIKPGSTGADVDELLRCIAARREIPGYKWYSGDVVTWVKAYQAAHPSLGTPDGIVGPLTFAAICRHP